MTPAQIEAIRKMCDGAKTLKEIFGKNRKNILPKLIRDGFVMYDTLEGGYIVTMKGLDTFLKLEADNG